LLAGKEQEKQMGWDRETDHQDWRVADMFSHFHDYFLGIAPPPAPLNSRFFYKLVGLLKGAFYRGLYEVKMV
jgi:hypothetical protein